MPKYYQNSNSQNSNNYWDQNLDSKKEKQKQSQINYQTQELLVDQNYANNILLMVFSTFESIAGLENGKALSKHQKVYGHYDKHDYRNKNLNQLLSQLQIHLLNFQTSKRLFQKKYGSDKYILPSKFNRKDFDQQINYLKTIFKGNDLIRNMVKDFSNLMQNVSCQTSYMKPNFQNQCWTEKQSQNNKKLVQNAIQSSQYMRDEKKKIINGTCQFSQNLPVQRNIEARKQNPYLNSSNGQINYRSSTK